MANRTQFTFYGSFAAALSRIKKKADRADAYDAICNYALYGKEPDYEKISDSVAIAFDLIKPTLDASKRKAEIGKVGGERKQTGSKPEANGKQTGSKPEANGKQTASKKTEEANRKLGETVSEKEKEKEGEKEKEKEIEIEKENECLKEKNKKEKTENIFLQLLEEGAL